MLAVKLNDIHLAYSNGRRRVDVFTGGDVLVDEHSVSAFVGPSGGGKSSLLNVISGIARPTVGSVEVLGVDLLQLNDNELADFRTRNVGFVFQAFHLIPYLDAASNVSLPLRLRGLSRRSALERSHRALEQMGLGARAGHRPYQLSGGEQQRVAIARALITGPKLLLADEPTGSLDGEAAEMVLDLLLDHSSGRTVIICTHDQAVAGRAGTVWRVGSGRIERHDVLGRPLAEGV